MCEDYIQGIPKHAVATGAGTENNLHPNYNYRITASLLLYVWREVLRTLRVPGLFSTVRLNIFALFLTPTRKLQADILN
jgi:hypothetical protein